MNACFTLHIHILDAYWHIFFILGIFRGVLVEGYVQHCVCNLGVYFGITISVYFHKHFCIKLLLQLFYVLGVMLNAY